MNLNKTFSNECKIVEISSGILTKILKSQLLIDRKYQTGYQSNAET